MRKLMIAVAASLALGTATMAVATMAFAHGGGGHFRRRREAISAVAEAILPVTALAEAFQRRLWQLLRLHRRAL